MITNQPHKIENIKGLHKIVVSLAENDNSFIIRGRRDDAKANQVLRRNINFNDVGNRWLVFDFDELDIPKEYNVLSDEAVTVSIKITTLHLCIIFRINLPQSFCHGFFGSKLCAANRNCFSL
jgi:hypothetical protein